MDEDANSLLQQIPVLGYGNKWSEFDRRARIWLEFCGYDDILVGEEPNARADNETEAAYEARKKSWRTRDSLAYSGIRSRLGKYAKIIAGGENHLKGIMQALESYFKNILFSLMISFWHKRLKDYDNVGNYAKSLMDINERVASICKEAVLPATQMALKFMVDLRSSGFHGLVMEWNEKYFSGQGGAINGVDFPTFKAMVSEAIEEERRLKGEKEQPIQQQEILREEIDLDSGSIRRSRSDENSNGITSSTKRQKRSHHNADDRVLSSSSPDSDLYFRTF
jgi:hypothetical protein